jgi:hypothetical protein
MRTCHTRQHFRRCARLTSTVAQVSLEHRWFARYRFACCCVACCLQRFCLAKQMLQMPAHLCQCWIIVPRFCGGGDDRHTTSTGTLTPSALKHLRESLSLYRVSISQSVTWHYVMELTLERNGHEQQRTKAHLGCANRHVFGAFRVEVGPIGDASGTIRIAGGLHGRLWKPRVGDVIILG